MSDSTGSTRLVNDGTYCGKWRSNVLAAISLLMIFSQVGCSRGTNQTAGEFDIDRSELLGLMPSALDLPPGWTVKGEPRLYELSDADPEGGYCGGLNMLGRALEVGLSVGGEVRLSGPGIEDKGPYVNVLIFEDQLTAQSFLEGEAAKFASCPYETFTELESTVRGFFNPDEDPEINDREWRGSRNLSTGKGSNNTADESLLLALGEKYVHEGDFSYSFESATLIEINRFSNVVIRTSLGARTNFAGYSDSADTDNSAPPTTDDLRVFDTYVEILLEKLKNN